MSDAFSLVRRLSQIGTLLHTFWGGKKVGGDVYGNTYYRERKTPKGLRERRWVIYAGEPDASKVPAEWHIWLHHSAEAPIADASRRVWQRAHVANMTGTAAAWMPAPAARAADRYSAWKPE